MKCALSILRASEKFRVSLKGRKREDRLTEHHYIFRIHEVSKRLIYLRCIGTKLMIVHGRKKMLMSKNRDLDPLIFHTFKLISIFNSMWFKL